MEQMNYFNLDGRVVLVTGAGQGVGQAIALAMASYKARAVVVLDFYLERAQEVCEKIRAMGCEALAVQADVTDRAQVRKAFQAVRERFGELHVLVNNAGNAGPGTLPSELPKFWETDGNDWEKWIGTNFYGVLNCSHEAVPMLIQHKQGRIITIVSDAGRVGEAGWAVYSGAKAGAAGFMRGLSRELGRYMATANCIALAATQTPGLAKRSEDADPELTKKKLAKYVIRRQGQPEDAAGAAVFLASNAGAWITGQTIPVNGGYSFNQ